jgi:hypothetical protein
MDRSELKAGMVGALLGGTAVLLFLQSGGRAPQSPYVKSSSEETARLPVYNEGSSNILPQAENPADNSKQLRELLRLRDEVVRLRQEKRASEQLEKLQTVGPAPESSAPNPAPTENLAALEPLYQRVVHLKGDSEVQKVLEEVALNVNDQADGANERALADFLKAAGFELGPFEQVSFQEKDQAVVFRSPTEQRAETLKEVFLRQSALLAPPGRNQ